MNGIGISKEKINLIARQNGVTDENIIKFITEVVSENNIVTDEYLEREYPDAIKNNIALSVKRMR